jgi:ornithine cyclodeaminase/alanine dehydrogenase-like protein (mu-crystallin family)
VSGIPIFTAAHVERAVSPSRAVDAVRDAFVEYTAGRWTMPPKVYVTNYPAGDFRAMPALGGGYALLKWINSFPGNPALGLPTVSGVVLLSDAESGQLRALLDAGSVTALRTGAAAVLAAEVLGRPGGTAAVIGAGVNGRATAGTFVTRGRDVVLWDVDAARAAAAARELGCRVAASLEEALGADLVATVTPGHTTVIGDRTLRPGQHVSLMGADGPGKAEATNPALLQGRLFCDDWEQASHGGELAHVVDAGLLGPGDVTAIGDVLAGNAEGRSAADDITLFDSTGLAIQDLAIALAAFEAADELDDLQRLEL